MKIKCFECHKKLCKENAWNIRRLGDDSFVPSAKPTSVLYHRLMDFWFGKPWRGTRIFFSAHIMNFAAIS